MDTLKSTSDYKRYENKSCLWDEISIVFSVFHTIKCFGGCRTEFF